MKKPVIFVLVLLLAMIVVPVAALDLSEFSTKNVKNTFSTPIFEKNGEPNAENSDTVKVMAKADGNIMTASVTEYLVGCVASEMPATYHEEALKAQAVAAYTNLVRLRKNPDSSLGGADISDDPKKHQGYLNEEQQKEKWGDKYERYHEKILSAVSEVAGEAVTYNSEPIVAAYCAISTGKTENASDIWGGELPYLVSVVSSGDKLSPDYSSTVVLSTEQLRQALSGESDIQLGDDPSAWIGNIERTEAGAVKNITIGSKTLTGANARKLFSLRSPAFSVEYSNGNFTFNVSGYGHLIGMSQYGADYMARNGSDYKTILTHYYTGTEIKKIPLE